MKEKPKLLNLLAFVYTVIALSFPIQIMYLYGHSLVDYQLIFYKMSLFNWLTIFLCTFNAYLLYEAKSALKYFIPLNLIVIAINNWFVSFVGVDYSNIQTHFATLLIIGGSSLLFITKTKLIIKDQKLIWWKWAQRVQKELPITVMYKDKELYKTNTFDISRTGAYIQYKNQAKPNTQTTKILKGEVLDFVIGNPGSKNVVKVRAKVVRKSKEHGNYPGGIGINFTDLNFKKSMKLMKLMHNNHVL